MCSLALRTLLTRDGQPIPCVLAPPSSPMDPISPSSNDATTQGSAGRPLAKLPAFVKRGTSGGTGLLSRVDEGLVVGSTSGDGNGTGGRGGDGASEKGAAANTSGFGSARLSRGDGAVLHDTGARLRMSAQNPSSCSKTADFGSGSLEASSTVRGFSHPALVLPVPRANCWPCS